MGHEELGHPDDDQDGVPDLVTDEAPLAVQILLEITDILLKLEYFVLEHLQLIWNVVNIFHVATLSDAFKIHNQRINQILIFVCRTV